MYSNNRAILRPLSGQLCRTYTLLGQVKVSIKYPERRTHNPRNICTENKTARRVVRFTDGIFHQKFTLIVEKVR